jgi:hypothetical protein
VAEKVLQPPKPLPRNWSSTVSEGRSPETGLPAMLWSDQAVPTGNCLSCRGCGTFESKFGFFCPPDCCAMAGKATSDVAAMRFRARANECERRAIGISGC